MSSYIPLPIDIEPVDIEQDAFDYIAAQVPGWSPSPGNLEAWLIEALAQTAGELRAIAAIVPDTIFAYYGASILGFAQYDAVPATAITTWTAKDGAGYTVPAGTVIALTPAASTDAYAFQLVSDLVFAPGTTVVSGVETQALEAGAAASDLTGTVAVIDQVVYISSVTLDAATYGGVDEEADDQYLSRLSTYLTLLAPRPIIPADFAKLVTSEIEGVARATAIDLYQPGPPPATGVPRCCTVAVCDSNGNACSSTVKANALALLQSAREVNFLVYVIDPTSNPIDVTFHVQCFPGYSNSDVAARVTQAIDAFLNPATWGLPPYGDTSGQSWINTTVCRYLELAQAVSNVAGVAYIETLTQCAHGGSLGTADVALTGAAPLTKPSTITGTADPA